MNVSVILTFFLLINNEYYEYQEYLIYVVTIKVFYKIYICLLEMYIIVDTSFICILTTTFVS